MDSVTISNNWFQVLNPFEFNAVDDDYILFDDHSVFLSFSFPYKLDASLVITCSKGSLEGTVDLRHFNEKAPFAVVILVNQIITFRKFSEDFKGYFTVMSTRFLENLFSSRKQSSLLYLITTQHPLIQLNSDELRSLLYFYKTIKAALKMKNNPHRIEIIKHLTLAFYYMHNYKMYEKEIDANRSKNEILVKEFLDMAGNNFKRNRQMEFYADRLFLTPKYLSKVIKECTGKSGNDWINEYVILEAKALLKSTKMTIQQISDDLNFPNQSFFGTYFKSHTGVSPKQYRKQ